MKRIELHSLIKSEKVLVLIDQAISSGCTFITTIILAKALPITDFGIYASIILVLYLLLSLSGAFIISPFQIHYSSNKNQQYSHAIVWIQTLLLILLTLFLVVISFIPIHFIQQISSYKIELILMIIGFIGQDFFRRYFLTISKPAKALLVDALSNIPQLILLFIVFKNNNLTLDNTLFIIALTFIPAVCVGFWFTKPKLPSKANLQSCFKLHVKDGKWLVLTAFTQWWSNHLLVVASALYLGLAALGALRLVQSLFGVLNVMLQVVENYILPKAAKLYHASAKSLYPFLRTITTQSLYVLIPSGVLMFLLAKPLLVLCGGEQYVSFSFAVKGMVILYALIFLGYPIRIAIRVLNLNKSFFTAYVLALLFSVFTSSVLIQQWQLTGVIVGLIMNQLLVLSYWIWVLIKTQTKQLTPSIL